ncbi:hypothetical protein RUND412_010585 [Rhizina undulata]
MANSGLARGVRRTSVRIFFKYLIDWVVVLAAVAFAGSTSFWAKPNIRPFSPVNPDISFPFQRHTKISTTLLVVLSIIVPAVVTAVASILLTRTPTNSPRTDAWRTKLYTWNSAWLGLGVSLASAMFITDGIKNLIGRPRPDMLSRCEPDPQLLDQFAYGGGPLVGWGVCATLYGINDNGLTVSDLRDGFRSFPSGHSSMSFSGLTYLTIFLLSHSFPIPWLNGRASPSPRVFSSLPRNFVIAVSMFSFLLAMYVASTRVSDFRHHGTDVLAGSILGITCAIWGWTMYGRGCIWNGGQVYVEELSEAEMASARDVEMAPMVPVRSSSSMEERDAIGEDMGKVKSDRLA